MKNLLIIVSLIAFAYSRVSNCAVDNPNDDKKCLVCYPKYKLENDGAECSEIIAHCKVYSNKQFTSCDYCEQGFSLKKQENDAYICQPNFEGEEITVCKPGYIKSGNGFCFFSISNCIEYSKDLFDVNKNPLCQKCYTSNGNEIDEQSPYISDYILSSDSTQCIPVIKGCQKQVDNKCVKSNIDRPLAGDGRWVCTKCKAGEIFQIDRCAPAVAPPCTEKPGYVLVGQPDGQSICLKTPDSLRDHCIEYDDFGECKKCKPAIISSCTKNEFNVYEKACWPQHQKSVHYILVQNTCVKEIMYCFEQDLNQNCLKCNFGYALINSAKNCARNHQFDLNLFTPKMTFQKIFARNTQTGFDNTNKRYWEDKQLATKINIFSQKEDFLEAVSQSHTYVKGEVQNPWDGTSRSYKTKVLLAGDENPVVLLQDEKTVSFHSIKEYPLNEYMFATPIPNTFIKKIEQSPF